MSCLGLCGYGDEKVGLQKKFLFPSKARDAAPTAVATVATSNAQCVECLAPKNILLAEVQAEVKECERETTRLQAIFDENELKLQACESQLARKSRATIHKRPARTTRAPLRTATISPVCTKNPVCVRALAAKDAQISYQRGLLITCQENNGNLETQIAEQEVALLECECQLELRRLAIIKQGNVTTITEKTARNQACENALSTLRTSKTTTEDNIAQIQSDLDACVAGGWPALLQAAEEEYDANVTRIDDLNAVGQECKDATLAIQAIIASQEAQEAPLNNQILAINTRASLIQAELDACPAPSTVGLRTSVTSTCAAEVTQLQLDITAQAAQILALDATYAQCVQESASLTEELPVLEAQLEMLQQSLQACQDQMAAYNALWSTVLAQRDHINTLTLENTQCAGELQVLQQRSAQLAQHILTLPTDLAEAKTALLVLDQQVQQRLPQLAACNATQISAGYYTTCVLDRDNVISTCGYNTYGSLGNGTTSNSSVPVKLTSGLPSFVAVSTRLVHTLALDHVGNVWTWGRNVYGQLGTGTGTSDSSVPVKLTLGMLAPGSTSIPLPSFVAISAGHNHSLALDEDGKIWAWGMNSNGQIGNGTYGIVNNLTVPLKLTSPSLPVFVSICAADINSFAIDINGKIWAWGQNGYGQLGNGTFTFSTVPIQINTIHSFVSVSASSNHTMAIDTTGKIWTWGQNGSSQLGSGTTTSSPTPINIATQPANASSPFAQTSFVSVIAGNYFSLALDNTGKIWVWGLNYYGQFGTGNYVTSNVPIKVNTTESFVAVNAGYAHCVAKASTGKIWTCGDNFSGALGDGTQTARLVHTLSLF